LSSAQIERNKTKEQLEEEKKISLSFRIKPLEIENLSVDKLRAKATELWEAIVKLETEKYDLEERQKRQDYDVGITSLAYKIYVSLFGLITMIIH
jgi:troponin T